METINIVMALLSKLAYYTMQILLARRMTAMKLIQILTECCHRSHHNRNNHGPSEDVGMEIRAALCVYGLKQM